MTNPEVSRYAPGGAATWNEFVRASRNGTFLFDRGYMDYHADRFRDHSLVITAGVRPIALLPAHEHGDELVSHGGLTYGGFVSGEQMTLLTMQRCFDAVGQYMRQCGLRRLVYKTVPRIYHRQPSDEDLHALFLRGASLFRRDVLLVIDNDARGPVQERRNRGVKKAARAGLVVRESHDYAAYWTVLTENLQTRYGCAPVHSVDEIRFLAARFPEQIRLTACYDGDCLLAGVVAYASPRVAHLQYIASSSEGRERGALDAVLEHLLALWRGKRYFDLGTVTEQDGRYVNAGLVEFKEGYGARTVVHDFYTLDV